MIVHERLGFPQTRSRLRAKTWPDGDGDGFHLCAAVDEECARDGHGAIRPMGGKLCEIYSVIGQFAAVRK
jgi:hypothetical protein